MSIKYYRCRGSKSLFKEFNGGIYELGYTQWIYSSDLYLLRCKGLFTKLPTKKVYHS